MAKQFPVVQFMLQQRDWLQYMQCMDTGSHVEGDVTTLYDRTCMLAKSGAWCKGSIHTWVDCSINLNAKQFVGCMRIPCHHDLWPHYASPKALSAQACLVNSQTCACCLLNDIMLHEHCTTSCVQSCLLSCDSFAASAETVPWRQCPW